MDATTPLWIESIGMVCLVAVSGIAGVFQLGKMERTLEHHDEEIEDRITKAEFSQVMERLDELQLDVREIRDRARNGKDHG